MFGFHPNQSDESEAPYGSLRCKEGFDRKFNWKKDRDADSSILNTVFYVTLRQLFTSLKPEWAEVLSSFKEETGWGVSHPTLALHVRTGNMENKLNNKQQHTKRKNHTLPTDESFLHTNRRIQNLTWLLASYSEVGEATARELGWVDGFQYFVTSDDAHVGPLFAAMTSRKVITRPQLLDIKYSHPLTYINLGENNGGHRCRVEWLVDPFLDLILLATADALLSASSTGFVIPAQVMHYNEGRVFCRGSASGDNRISCFRRGSGDVHTNKDKSLLSAAFSVHMK